VLIHQPSGQLKSQYKERVLQIKTTEKPRIKGIEKNITINLIKSQSQIKT
jgi:hypothetical protein